MSKMQTWGRQKGDTQGCHFTLGRLHSSRTEALLTSQMGQRLGRGAPHFPDRNLPRLLGGRGRSTVTAGLYVGSCVPLLLPYVADVFCDFCSISLACLILVPLWLTALCTVSFLPQEQAYPFLPQDSLKL